MTASKPEAPVGFDADLLIRDGTVIDGSDRKSVV